MTAILIDADPGQDDALAILLAIASPSLSVQAITAVAGNVPVALAAANARRVCDLAARHVRIFAGAAAPLIFGLETAEFVCGPDGPRRGHAARRVACTPKPSTGCSP